MIKNKDIEYKVQQCNNFGITKKGSLFINYTNDYFTFNEETPEFRKALAKEYIKRWKKFGQIE